MRLPNFGFPTRTIFVSGIIALGVVGGRPEYYRYERLQDAKADVMVAQHEADAREISARADANIARIRRPQRVAEVPPIKLPW